MLDTYSGRMWNCKSSIFWPWLRELRNPALSCVKAVSSGARMVRPPLFAVMSCEFMLFMISVVFKRRVRTVNDLAFFRILVMSSGVESEESGESGNVGTNGFDVGAVAFGAGAAFGVAFGEAAGAGAAKLEEYKEENMSRKRDKENRACFIF